MNVNAWASLLGGDLHALRTFVLSAGALGPLAVIGLMLVHTVLPFPAEVVTLVAGAVYGPWLGLLFTWIGAMAGGMAGFALARWIGHPLLRRWLPPRAKEISERWIGDHAAWSLLVLRLLPFVSFNLINYAAGLSEVDFWTFLWTMAVGILPFSILLVLLGAEAARRSAFVLVLLAALVALVAAGQWLRRRTARATREQP